MADELITKQAVLDLAYKGGQLDGMIPAYEVEKLAAVECSPEDEYISRQVLVALVEESKRDNTHKTMQNQVAHKREHEHFLRIIEKLPNAPVVLLEEYLVLEVKHKELQLRHKRLLETANILDDALREYQKEYGERR